MNIQAGSLIDEFNRKLVERGADKGVLNSELPAKGKQRLMNTLQRPMSSKPAIRPIQSNKKLMSEHTTANILSEYNSQPVSNAYKSE